MMSRGPKTKKPSSEGRRLGRFGRLRRRLRVVAVRDSDLSAVRRRARTRRARPPRGLAPRPARRGPSSTRARVVSRSRDAALARGSHSIGASSSRARRARPAHPPRARLVRVRVHGGARGASPRVDAPRARRVASSQGFNAEVGSRRSRAGARKLRAEAETLRGQRSLSARSRDERKGRLARAFERRAGEERAAALRRSAGTYARDAYRGAVVSAFSRYYAAKSSGATFLDSSFEKELASAVENMPAFANLPRRHLVRVFEAAQFETWPKGSVVWREGARSDAMAILVGGEMALFQKPSNAKGPEALEPDHAALWVRPRGRGSGSLFFRPRPFSARPPPRIRARAPRLRSSAELALPGSSASASARRARGRAVGANARAVSTARPERRDGRASRRGAVHDHGGAVGRLRARRSQVGVRRDTGVDREGGVGVGGGVFALDRTVPDGRRCPHAASRRSRRSSSITRARPGTPSCAPGTPRRGCSSSAGGGRRCSRGDERGAASRGAGTKAAEAEAAKARAAEFLGREPALLRGEGVGGGVRGSIARAEIADALSPREEDVFLGALVAPALFGEGRWRRRGRGTAADSRHTRSRSSPPNGCGGWRRGALATARARAPAHRARSRRA